MRRSTVGKETVRTPNQLTPKIHDPLVDKSRLTNALGSIPLVAVWFLARFHVAFKAPTVNNFGVETPIGANAEARQLTAAQKLINCRWMNAQISG